MREPSPRRTSHRSPPRCRRRGNAIVYGIFAVVVLIAVGVLAVDYARVQLVKTEAQRSVDAASRAALQYLPSDPTAARNAAVSLARMNTVDGTPLLLLSSDVEIGKWNAANATLDTTSTVPDAVRITGRRTRARGQQVNMYLADVFGYRSVDVTVSQTTKVTGGTVGGFVGYDGIAAKNNLFIASYNAGVTTSPGQSDCLSNAGLGSNGAIDAKNNNELKGNAYLGPAGSIAGVSVTGTSAPRSAPLVRPSSPAWAPGTNPGGVPQNYAVTGTNVLPGGTYWFTGLTVSGTLDFSGPATLYVNGDVNVAGTLAAYQDRPANLKVYVLGARTVCDSGNNNVDITADIEAPSSAFAIKNNLAYRGRLLAATIDLKNNADLYYDESLGDAGGAMVVTTISY